jgi:beta-lactamase superfamily II metal-dependent hydrolase
MNSKKYLLILCSFFLIIFYFFWIGRQKVGRLVFFDVGQGDSSLIILPSGHKILIDGGPDDQVLSQLGIYLNFFDRKIDYLILSHEHDDHVFGLVQVISRYQIKTIIHSSNSCLNPSCLEFFRVAKKMNINIKTIESDKKLIFSDNCFLKILAPENLLAKNINNRSLAFKLDCGSFKALMTGDGEFEREQELLSSGEDLSAIVFKAGHHGSNTSNGENFLRAIQPKLAVIFVGKNNSFHHPAEKTLQTLKNLGIKFFRTDVNGNISLNFLGKSYPQISIDKE